MRLSQAYFKTYKQDPQDAEITSHKLLVRAGYIKKQSMGSYIFLPIGLKMLQKITNIVRDEMNAASSHEVLMPMLLPEEVYEHRIKNFGPSMFRLRDRNGKGMCLGPTHEEIFTQLMKDTVSSYKSLPLTLYQIGTKFRDEIRPRFGLQRAREFVMKDAYSYDKDLNGLNASFEVMKETYIKIFNRLGLKFVIVDADNGSMGGFGSNEFMVKSNVGEDEIAVCEHCNYAANIEKAECVVEKQNIAVAPKAKQKVETPQVKTIADVASFLKLNANQIVKSVVYSTDKGLVVVYLRGDREVEEVKVVNYLKTIKCELASPEDIASMGSVAGYVGPSADFKKVTILADLEIQNMSNFVMGANEEGYHIKNCNLSDLPNATFLDVRKISQGDPCPKCGHPMDMIRGIEVGHIFKLGTHYTKQLNCTYLDENGKEQLMVMGCYGIGVSRALSAIVEQNNDENGMIWSRELAPYQASIFPAVYKDETEVSLASKLYEQLTSLGVEVILDDRKESYGVKFKDAQLIGLPFAIVAGKDSADGKLEVINRVTKETKLMTVEEIVALF